MSIDASSALSIEIEGRRREFALADLPVTIGGSAGADVTLSVPGAVQIGRLGDVYFVQAGRATRNVRVDGQPLTGTQSLSDGSVIALDRARLRCTLEGSRLAIAIELLETAADTAPPDLADLPRVSPSASDEIAITPIAFNRADGAGTRAVRRRIRPGTIAVSAAFAVLAVLAWFAFTARSVAIRIEPTPQRVSLPDTLFKLRVGDRFLLRTGEHRITAELPGYYPLDQRIEVGFSPDQSFTLTMQKLPGLVSLSTDPPVAASVSLDGVPLGTAPLTDVEITPGLHRLEVTAERYLPQVLELDVRGGHERQSLVATLAPNWAPVTVTTTPPGAEVLVDGAPAGTTPVTLELTAGQREIEARLTGYNAWRTSLLVTAGQPQELPPVTLARADGRVELVSSPSEASVSVNGEFRGRTPLTLRLTPERTHRVTLTKPGYETVTRELSVAADSGRRVVIELVAQYGEIEVRSDPPNAQIWVDGQREGVTPGRLTLTAIEHEIEVRQSGYASKTARITPRPGYSQVVTLTLEQLDSTSGSGFPSTLRTGLGQELKLIPAGQFTMGSSRREQGRRSNEVLRPVRLTRAFYLGVHEVTNAEFRQFKPDHDSGSYEGQSLNGDSQPVVNVTWEEVAQFLNWLSIRDGLQPVYEERQGTWAPVRPLRNGYRLPTEAEWEWAARFAGRDSGLLYPWGNDLPPPDRSGNYADVSARSILPTTLVTYDDRYAVTAPVGSFDPNPFGLFDLGGNVAEWVQDFYTIDIAENSPLVDDPLGPETGRFHVVRGSSWRSATVTDLRMAARGYSGERRDDVGFRIARNLQ